jgi:hypothetical protein
VHTSIEAQIEKGLRDRLIDVATKLESSNIALSGQLTAAAEEPAIVVLMARNVRF